MSVSLTIRWPDRTKEDLSIGSLRGARMWGCLASELGLPLMSTFYETVPVTRDNLAEFVREVSILRNHFAEDPEQLEWQVTAERLLEAFARLKRSDAWDAYIG